MKPGQTKATDPGSKTAALLTFRAFLLLMLGKLTEYAKQVNNNEPYTASAISAPIFHLIPDTKTLKTGVTFNVIYCCKWASDLVFRPTEKIT
jgi:hypothetical protein